jgi:hypothetical protein
VDNNMVGIIGLNRKYTPEKQVIEHQLFLSLCVQILEGQGIGRKIIVLCH